jgi:hypothetical protein
VDENQQLVFFCGKVDARDVFTAEQLAGKKLVDIQEFLLDKYGNKIVELISADESPRIEFYRREGGSPRKIEETAAVADILAVTDKVGWRANWKAGAPAPPKTTDGNESATRHRGTRGEFSRYGGTRSRDGPSRSVSL